MQNIGYGREAAHAKTEFCIHSGLESRADCRLLIFLQAPCPSAPLRVCAATDSQYLHTSRLCMACLCVQFDCIACHQTCIYIDQLMVCTPLHMTINASPVQSLSAGLDYTAQQQQTHGCFHEASIALQTCILSVGVCVAGALRQALLIGYDHPRMEGLWPSERLCPGFK